jgi:hypothetical protein
MHWLFDRPFCPTAADVCTPSPRTIDIAIANKADVPLHLLLGRAALNFAVLYREDEKWAAVAEAADYRKVSSPAAGLSVI